MDNRSYAVLSLIKESIEPISAQSLQEKLLEKKIKVNIKTVYEIIRRINEFYFPILKTKYIGVRRKKGYFIAYNYFEDGQIQYLLDSVKSNPNLSKQETDNLESRILSLSSKSQMERISGTNPVNKQSISLLLNLTTLMSAINNQQNIYFEYVDYKVEKNKFVQIASENGNLKQANQNYYVVSPYEIILQGKYYYLLGYFDNRKDQLSIYRIDRMRLIRHHKSPFVEIREQYDMKQVVKQSVNMFFTNEKIDLKLRFTKRVMREVINQFGDEHHVTKEINDTYCIAVKDITNSDGLVGWIFMLQDQVEVIEPLMLREKVQRLVKNMYKVYK